MNKNVRCHNPCSLLFVLLFVAVSAQAAPSTLGELLKSEIAKTYAGAQIQFQGDIQWVKGQIPNRIDSVSVLGDDTRGNMRFVVKGENQEDSQVSPSTWVEAEGLVSFSALAPVRVPNKRIHPGELLREEMFTRQFVDVSRGMAREYRGLLFSNQAKLAGLEAIQTLIEGQFLTTSAIQKTPDVRRGDLIRIHLISPGMALTTSGIAEEAGYIQGKLKVMTSRTKRELTGLLRSGGVVEVQL